MSTISQNVNNTSFIGYLLAHRPSRSNCSTQPRTRSCEEECKTFTTRGVRAAKRNGNKKSAGDCEARSSVKRPKNPREMPVSLLHIIHKYNSVFLPLKSACRGHKLLSLFWSWAVLRLVVSPWREAPLPVLSISSAVCVYDTFMCPSLCCSYHIVEKH